MLRAILSSDGASIKTLTRGFEIAPPKVLMTSAEGLGDASVDAELFLPVDDATMTPAFQRDAAVDETTLAPFRERVAPTREGAVRSGRRVPGGRRLSRRPSELQAARSSPTSTARRRWRISPRRSPPAGHDSEAASAWQTALVDGTDFPQIYQWLGDALLRTHDFGEARAILEEAAGKWPTDRGSPSRWRCCTATFGRGREAVRTLERYLDERQDDRDALLPAPCSGSTPSTPAAPSSTTAPRTCKLRARVRRRVRESTSGPQAALVKQWVDYLDEREVRNRRRVALTVF